MWFLALKKSILLCRIKICFSFIISIAVKCSEVWGWEQDSFSSVQSLSCVWLFATSWTAACPVHYQLLELAQTHVHWISDAIQPFHPVSPISSCLQSFPASCLFQWVSSSHQAAKVLELQLQYQSFQWIFKTDFLEGWLVWSPCSPRDSQESSPTPQFKSINSLAVSFLYGPTLTSIHDCWKNHSFD